MVVSKANQRAKDRGKTSFCIYQGHRSILERSLRRGIIHMAMSEGLALGPWGVVEQGRLMTDEEYVTHVRPFRACVMRSLVLMWVCRKRHTCSPSWAAVRSNNRAT
jgi:aryl-alcohol dehydrogenase-like predicted oxidoreductase